MAKKDLNLNAAAQFFTNPSEDTKKATRKNHATTTAQMETTEKYTRKTFIITEDQHMRLKILSAKTKTDMSVLVRQALEYLLGKENAE